ncbi:probable apyrase 6 isoform X1 [Actinidia eriantha]|uniref:probable apyrase 6 isoform X1 n=1 Tax=Actinidia eriantha TaxID=165200 RepID=UPI00258F16AC|nr:probable apyrase 6 isoform X1 [Actinidia eriantha]
MRRSNARTLGRKMDSIKLHFRQNSPRRSNLFSRNPKNATNTTKSNILIFALITVTLALFCYVFVPSIGYRNPAKRKFRIVIDGGSTGTRIHVFEYVIRGGVPSFDFGENGLGSIRVNPGLSSFAEDPEGAGGSLGELVEFGKKRVPKEYWGETEIRLMATAGLRMLDLGVQARILESCRKFLRVSRFKFQDDWASVITGSDEGVYAWVAANYALDTLGGDPMNTTGIIELGGASAQVTFVSSEPIPSEFSHIVKIGNITYNLYSHSLLQFGQNVAFDLLRESLVSRSPDSDAASESLEREKLLDPCIPSGYSHSTKPGTLSTGSKSERSKYPSALLPRGNFSECRSAALMLLQKGKERCTYQHCYIGSTFIPKLQGNFLATENFFHTSKFFGLAPRAFIPGMMRAGQQFCEEDWSKLRIKYHSLEEEDLLRYCFSSAYIVAILHDSLGIALDDERIGFANQVGEVPLDWALGAFILQSTADLNTEQPPNWIATTVINDSHTFIAIIVIAMIVMFGTWSLSKWRKPQLKTIYDLEKGKYIVTRVSRYS